MSNSNQDVAKRDYDDVVATIAKDPKFHAIVKKKQRYSLTLLALTLGMYLIIILASSFARDLVATPISANMVTTWGIPAGFFLIVWTVGLIALYVNRTNKEFDTLNKELLEEVTHEKFK